MLKGLKPAGTFLLNSIWDEEETKKHLPPSFKKYLAENDINFYIINATKIAKEIGLGNRTNTIMQAAFFKIANVIPYELAEKEMKDAVVKTFSKKGEDIVNMNIAAIERGGKEIHKVEVPKEWKNIELKDVEENNDNVPEFIKKVVEPINALKGDDLPVSAFVGREDGTFPQGTSQYEKRGVAVFVPEWKADACIQCNLCAYSCPHAVIRPFLLDDNELKNAPKEFDAIIAKPEKQFGGLHFRIQVSVLDCTGCGVCVDVCPTDALSMKPLEEKMEEADIWNYLHYKVGYKENVVPKDKTVKNSQFAQPLFEFSGACAGCGETPYIKLATQLYGERMMIANATGCSSIYGGSAPSTPYTLHNVSKKGPSWANSLFEDNAEYGYGMALGVGKLRGRIMDKMKEFMNEVNAETQAAFKEWIDVFDDGEKSKSASEKVIKALEKETHPIAKDILSLKDYLVKKSIWIIGGDGWAYDIGYGGLDHVLASGEDVNLLVLDTEVYSNTGGQASKASQTAQIAKFASAGKPIRKKDLGAMAMTYGYVYVAQVAMGANQNQLFKAMKEAEEYKGPSLIIAYSTCIAHGLKKGMNKAQYEEKLAVEAGYWTLYRFNPMLEAKGKNPFSLDSKEPNWSKFEEFLNGEVRYNALKRTFPEKAEAMFKQALEDAQWRWRYYKRLSEAYKINVEV